MSVPALGNLGPGNSALRDTEFTGRTVLVTGAARGIGAAVCAALASGGARVVATDRDGAAVATTARQLACAGLDVVSRSLDVSDAQAVDDLVAAVEHVVGPIEVLVNVAGVLRLGAVVDLTDDDWDQVLAVNATGVFLSSRSVARRMVSRRSGSIITVASNAASVPRMRMAAYAASKAASVAFTKCLGLELAEYGIRCNVVSPGSTDTPMLRELWGDDPDASRATLEGALGAHRIGVPLGRLARPIDVAEAVRFLASDRSSHITLHDMCVDGGAALGA